MLRVVHAQQNSRSFVEVGELEASLVDGSLAGADGYEADREPEGGDDDEDDLYDPKQDIVEELPDDLTESRPDDADDGWELPEDLMDSPPPVIKRPPRPIPPDPPIQGRVRPPQPDGGVRPPQVRGKVKCPPPSRD